MAAAVTSRTVVSCTAFPPLPHQGNPDESFCQPMLPQLCAKAPAVYFCCTCLGVASTGRYPASCPVKPGLSSAAKAAAIIYPTYVYIVS